MKYQTILFDRSDSFLRFGRASVAKDGSISLPWSSSGFAFRFRGDGVIFHFGPYKADAPAYVRVWTDGRPQRFAVSDGREKIILEDLGEGEHEVKLLRVTEGNVPLILPSLTLTSIFSGDDLPALCAPPAPKPLRIAFIGDSITCGYGVLGPASEPGFQTYEEDSSRSYASLTAELLNAEVCISGASGKGIVANCVGNREDLTLRQAFRWATPTGGEWDHSEWIPDAIVVNAGTNDAWGGVSDEEFIPNAVSLLSEIRSAYPEKPILYCYGVMDTSKQNAINAAVEQFTQTHGNVFVLFVPSMYEHPEEVGGGGHPNLVTSERVSSLLAEKLKEILLA